MTRQSVVIAMKELRELLVTGRFQAAAALVFGLMTVTMALATRSFARALQEYGIADAARLESLRQDGHLNRVAAWTAPEPPNPLSILVSGRSGNGRFHAFQVDGLAIAYPPADVVLVIGIVLSLVAVLFAHDAFTGERERGTLRLLVSGTASRGDVLLGKLVGRIAALLVPLLAGILVGALVLALSRGVQWGRMETAAFLALAGIAILFVAVFVALGILVSAWTRTTHGSLAGSLLAWAVFILVIPSVAPYAAAALAPTGNYALHQRALFSVMDDERDALVEELRREWQAPVLAQHPAVYDYYALPRSERDAHAAANPELAAVLNRLSVIFDSAVAEANARQRAKRDRMADEFKARRDAQVRLTGRFASLSPYSALVLASLELSETGERARTRYTQQRRQWEAEVYRPWYAATVDSLRSANLPGDWTNARIGLTDLPRFEYAKEPVGARVAAALPPVGALGGFGLLFVLAAFAGFSRYDVR